MSIVEVKIPSPGESITEVEIASWAKADGDFVEKDEVLCEVETDKATLPIYAEVSGTLKIVLDEGTEAKVGDVVCSIDTSGSGSATASKEDAPQEKSSKDESSKDESSKDESSKEDAPQEKVKSSKEETSQEDAPAGDPVDVKIPSPGESITEVSIASWAKEEGDFVEKDEVLCEVETDKATLPIYAEISGTLKIVLEEGAEAKVGDVVCSITPGSSSSGASKEAASQADTSKSSAPAADASSHAAGVPSVAAAKMMAEKGIKAEEVEGTGKGGRITKGDVLAHKPKKADSAPAKKSATPSAPESAPTPATGGTREARHEKMSRIRKKIAERLVSVKNETAMLTTFNEVDMSAVMGIRSKYKDQFLKKYDIKLGFMSFFTKACAEALQEFPAVNAMIDGEEIVYHEYVDMGIAVSAPKGFGGAGGAQCRIFVFGTNRRGNPPAGQKGA